MYAQMQQGALLAAPKDGRVYRVIGVCRISTVHQDERSLADQKELCRQWLTENLPGPFRLQVISSRESGERLDRKEFKRLKKAIRSGKFDLVVAEDLGRIARRLHAAIVCELCEDHSTRLVAINDHLDTSAGDWRLSSLFATYRHESYNRDTGKRIRRSLRNRFQQGCVVQVPLFCYRKMPGSSSDADLGKIPELEPIVLGIFERLEDGSSYAEVADWLNEQQVPLGPGSRSNTWRGKMVSRIIHNPILKGLRVRNRKMAVRVNRTGRHKSVDAPPSELLQRDCPHLAFVSAERYDRLIELLATRNGKFRRAEDPARDPCRGRPRKRTRWPGQHIFCGVCGRMYVYGGHGQSDHLMCQGAKDYQCWNAISVDGQLAGSKLAAAITTAIEALPDYEELLRTSVQENLEELTSSRETRLRSLTAAESKNARERANLVAALRDVGSSPTLIAELRQLEEQTRQIADELAKLRESKVDCDSLPSTSELKQVAREKISGLLENSQSAARMIRRLVPRIVVLPYRLIDGGRIVLRATCRLSLSPLVQLDRQLTEPFLGRELVVDLFDPPQREVIRAELWLLRQSGISEREAAKHLGVTVTAAQRAAALQREMLRRGISDPYEGVLEPPADFPKLRRHKHRRYRFEPLTE